MTKIETNVIKPEISFTENEINNLIITPEFEGALDAKISEIESYIQNNHGKDKSDEEKDNLYKNAQDIWREYAIILRDTKYNFYLNHEQYKFLTNLILTKLEYDVNTVFFAIELTNLLGSMKEARYNNDKELIGFTVNATEITYIYHLISPFKIKGLTKDAYTFTQVLRRIGDISKVFNYYDTAGKNLSTDIQDWATSFEDGVILEGETVETVEGKLL